MFLPFSLTLHLLVAYTVFNDTNTFCDSKVRKQTVRLIGKVHVRYAFNNPRTHSLHSPWTSTVCETIIIAFELVMQIINNNKEFNFRNGIFRRRRRYGVLWKRQQQQQTNAQSTLFRFRIVDLVNFLHIHTHRESSEHLKWVNVLPSLRTLAPKRKNYVWVTRLLNII